MLQQERLVEMGRWLDVNGEAIYGTRPWTVSSEGPPVGSVNPRLDKSWKWVETTERPMVHYTRKGDVVYAICLAWPGRSLKLGCPTTTPRTQVSMLGHSESLKWAPGERGLIIEMPEMSSDRLPCQHAWTFRLTELQAAIAPR